MSISHPLIRLSVAVVAVGLALLARQALDPVLGDQLPYPTFFLAVALSAWLGGAGSALAATLVGGLAATWFFVEPRQSFHLEGPADLVGIAAYGFVGLTMAGLRWLSERSEGRARANEDRFRSLLGAILPGVWIADPDGLLVEVSPAWLSFTGQRPSEARRAGWLAVVHPADRQGVAERWAEGVSNGAPFEFECRVQRADGASAWTLGRAAPVSDADGSLREWIVTHHDVSERKQAEGERARLAAIVESSSDAIVGKTLEGIVTSWNRGAELIFGYSAEEMVGQPIARLLPPDRADDLRSILGALGRGERVQSFETERVRKDGRRIHVSLTVSPIVDAYGRILGASKVARDVSERKEAEERMRGLLAFNQAVLRHMGEGLYTVDDAGCVTSLNPAAEQLFGYSHEELLGRKMHDLTHYQHPDGTPFPAEDCAVLEVVRNGTVLRDHEDVFIRKDGSFFPVVYSAAPLVEGGRRVGLVVVFRDMTQQQRAAAEREELLAEAEHARAVAEAASRTKDEFLSVVSHELRTPLSSIMNWLYVLRGGQASLRERALDSMQRSAEAQSRLIEDLLDVSRIVSGKLRVELRPVAVAEVVRAALDTVRPTADAKGVHLGATLCDAGVTVAGDPDRLQQIVWNLLSNAVKFTPAGGQVGVTLEVAKRHVQLVVRDSGKGIEPAFLHHVFERFQQAEPAVTRRHGGLGLGLAIVRHLVELHGGDVAVESEGEGKGSTFRVTLPRLARTATASDVVEEGAR